MDGTTEAPVALLKQRPLETTFQSIEDFEQEQKRLGAVGKVVPPPPRKKSKTFVDINAIVAERAAVEELGSTNWVGKLLEYRAAHPTTAEGVKFLDEAIGSPVPRFICTVLIAESSNQFGGNAVTFANKKYAKAYASKKAVDWLVDNEYIPAAGSTKFPNVALANLQQQQQQRQQPQAQVQAQRAVPGVSSPEASRSVLSTTTYASQIPDLCHRLGFNVPRYELTSVAESGAVWDAHADFGADPRVDGKVGAVKNIYGKKNAKEESAKIVFAFLKDIETQRMMGY